MKIYNLLLLTLFLISACDSKSQVDLNHLREDNLIVEELILTQDELPTLGNKQKAPTFPWEIGAGKTFSPITMDYFRCKGSSLNPIKSFVDEHGKFQNIKSCGGFLEHGLPLHENRERIQPILITLLNFIQEKLEQRVVITSGHRCPTHNAYVDPSKANQTSKHLLGAAVSFYVEHFEERPQEILNTLFSFFTNDPFLRWDKTTDVSTRPWYNEEIFVKLYKKEEGRDFDNRHPFPYISIQVRFDKENKEKITYSYDKGHRNYLRK